MTFEEAYQKFLDIRKRVVRFPKANNVKLVCIPTTSGRRIATVLILSKSLAPMLCENVLAP